MSASLSVADVDWARLSPRSRETMEKIVPLVESGKTNDEVAAELELPPREIGKALQELRVELEAQVHGAQLNPLAADDFDALKESIRTLGQRVPIIVDAGGRVIDGNHRSRACAELGITPWTVVVEDVDQADQLRAIALAVNVARRQLSTADKRRLCEQELIHDPEASDRSIAERVGVTHPTVAAARRDLEARGKVERLSTRRGSDGVIQPLKPDPEPEHPPVSMFHLRDGFYFGRDGDQVVITAASGTIRVPVNEWASAVASTSKRGENAETFGEALDFLEAA